MIGLVSVFMRVVVTRTMIVLGVTMRGKSMRKKMKEGIRGQGPNCEANEQLQDERRLAIIRGSVVHQWYEEDCCQSDQRHEQYCYG